MESKHINVAYAGDPVSAMNSGDTGNGTERNGDQFDLQGVTGRRYRKVHVALPYDYSLASGITQTVASNLQHRETTSGTGSTWADFGTAPSNHTLTNSATNAATGQGKMLYEQDLTSAGRYLRVQWTPSWSTTATGSLANFNPVLILSDANQLPATG